MANTAILRYKVEPLVRAALAEEFLQRFSSQVLTLPGGAVREFDAVSDDGTVVASIKTRPGLTSGGNIPGGKINGCIADLYYLSLLNAPVRLQSSRTPISIRSSRSVWRARCPSASR
jgi:hypothetical protein